MNGRAAAVWLFVPGLALAQAPAPTPAPPADAAAPPAAAQDAAKDAAAEEEVVELTELDDLEDLEAGAGAASPTAEVLAYFHPALVHLPAAWLLLLVLVDFLGLVRRSETYRRAGGTLAWVTWLSFPPAALTGMMRLEVLGLDGSSAEPALLHRNLAITAFMLVTFAVAIRWRAPALPGILRWAYLGMVGVAAGVIAVAGHLGGAMVFGDPPF